MIGVVRGVIGATLMLLFVAMLVTTFSRRQKVAFDRLARSILDEEGSQRGS